MEINKSVAIIFALGLSTASCSSGSAPTSNASESAPTSNASESTEVNDLVAAKDSPAMTFSCGAHKAFLEQLESFGLDSLSDGEPEPADGPFGGMIMPTSMHLMNLPIFIGKIAEQVGPIDDAAPEIANDTYREWLNIGSTLNADAEQYGAYTYDSQILLLESLDRINTNCTMVFGPDWSTLVN